MEGGRTLTELAIQYAAAAGALRIGARRYPDAAKGLLKAAALRSAKAATFAGQICKPAVWPPSGLRP